MFREYEKTFRIQNAAVKVSGKLTLSHADERALLIGKVTIEEKIDGANVGIIGGKKGKEFRLQKRSALVDIGEHPQYGRFKAWTMERYVDFMKLRFPYVVYGEFLWAMHHIFYDSLPDWFICFDVWDGEKYINRKEKEDFCQSFKLEVVPLLYEGYIENIDQVIPYVFGPSAYSSNHWREGIQVKNYRKQMRGKIVNPEFVKELNEDGKNWTTHWDPRKINKLRNA